MASAHKDSKGWRICYVDPNGDKKQIRPSKGTNKATANQLGRHIGELVACIASKGTLSRPTALWLGEIGDALHTKLANAGLVEPRGPVEPEREPMIVQLHDFVNGLIRDGKTASGATAADSTVRKWKTTQVYLRKHFANVDVASITPVHAPEFRQ